MCAWFEAQTRPKQKITVTIHSYTGDGAGPVGVRALRGHLHHRGGATLVD